MKRLWLAIGIVPALAMPAVWAAQHAHADAKDGRLTRVQPDDADDADGSQSFDRDAWKKRMTQGDLDQRMRDFNALARRARRDRSVREAIESWAHDPSNADLSWTSRLLLREADSLAARPDRLGWNAFGAPDWNDLQSRFDDLQQRFGGMDSMFGDLQAEIDRLRRDGFRSVPFGNGGGAGGGTSSSQSFTLQVGPDGVTCRVHENVDGKDATKEYKADSMDALLEAHPELRDRIHSGGGFGWNGPLFSRGWGDSNGARDLSNDAGANGSADRAGDRGGDRASKSSASPRTDIFGVDVTKPAPEKLQELNLEPERGLYVQRTVPGTIAQILGVKRGDILIEMNGVALYGRDDIAKVLHDRAPDGEIVATLIDGKGQRRTLTWRPSGENAAKSSGQSSATDKADETRKK